MRITNKIIQNNSLANINTNKLYQDKLSTQMSTQKKITRPSDDPVVAIRALRLRSNVTEVTQYYSKNIPDAESWLSVTEDALGNLSSVITDMIKQFTSGSNGDLTSTDRQIILEQLQALSDEVYSTGNVDYAGRSIFTGYRTDTTLSYTAAETKLYSITEQLSSASFSSLTVINTSSASDSTINLADLNETNYNSIAVSETDITSAEIHRMRLAYNDCTGTAPTISFQEDDGTGTNTYNTVSYTAETVHSYEDPYTQIANETGEKVIFVPETGELLYSQAAYERLMATKDSINTLNNNEGEIRITYEKDSWLNGDLRPEHYFNCTSEGVEYNASYLDYNSSKQVISYDVGFNQSIAVNTTADECFQPGIAREIDDLVNAMKDVTDMEEIVSKLESMLESADESEVDTIQSRLNAANKALTLMTDKVQKLFEQGITTMQKYLDATNLSITNCGTRSSKLDLIKSRMQTQKTSFETLKSENEDVDITEVAIQLSSAELTYEAALMAVGKIMQTSLLNYI